MKRHNSITILNIINDWKERPVEYEYGKINKYLFGLIRIFSKDNISLRY